MIDNLDLIQRQEVILCNELGYPTGKYFPRFQAHKGRGKKHLAISLLLTNTKGQVLLQRRKHRIFNNFWDLTGATDLLHNKDGNNEDWLQAAIRCLEREYSLKSLPLQNVGGFSYFSKDGDLCENEYCYLVIGTYQGEVNLNPEVGYEYKWIKKTDTLQDIKDNPQKYTPWAQEAVKPLIQIL